jgi:hypothetical protein
VANAGTLTSISTRWVGCFPCASKACARPCDAPTTTTTATARAAPIDLSRSPRSQDAARRYRVEGSTVGSPGARGVGSALRALLARGGLPHRDGGSAEARSSGRRVRVFSAGAPRSPRLHALSVKAFTRGGPAPVGCNDGAASAATPRMGGRKGEGLFSAPVPGKCAQTAARRPIVQRPVARIWPTPRPPPQAAAPARFARVRLPPRFAALRPSAGSACMRRRSPCRSSPPG